ncbi:hypothetical protein HAX54_009018 [Datura stramonium]|uniref:Protein kinase domain-containing protein n=1 Tax=Datura stramonium TaxID=4076 RepID=A0ABS8TFZ7_DATST|nr:hypothetical protein [Datura stramonium]
MEARLTSGKTENGKLRNVRLCLIGSAVGGVVLISVSLVVILFCLKSRKAKPVENSNWPMVSVYRKYTEVFWNSKTEITVLSKFGHQHLFVSLIGYCDERYEMILVYEFMEKGTLREHLYSSKEDLGKSSSESELSWGQRLQICIGAANGLDYLHTGLSEPIIHRDIKSTNILLDEHYVAKVADFGLSKSGPPEQTHIVTDVKGKINSNSLRKFGETVEKCLQEDGTVRPNMKHVIWDLKYALQLQHPAMPQESHEDSTTDVSWQLVALYLTHALRM